MAEARHDMRVNSSEKCELNLDGSRYQCRITNISSSGAMVNCIGFLREIWPGDRGVLLLPDQAANHGCHITHIAAAKIGLHFDD
jgi:hypothetical protein